MGTSEGKSGAARGKLPANCYWRGEVIWARFKVRGVEYRESLRCSAPGIAAKRLALLKRQIEDVAIYGDSAPHSWPSTVVAWRADGVSGIRASTLKRYQVSLRMLKPWLDPLDVHQVDLSKVKDIVRARRKHASNATVRRDLSALSSVLAHAVCEGWVATNAAREFDRQPIPERRDPFELPERPAITAMLEAAPRRFADMIQFAEVEGMRQEEIAGLSHKAIDRNRMSITLTRTKARRRRTRTVPLSARGLAIIDRQPVYLGSDFVFWHDQGERYGNVASRFGTIRKGVAQRAARLKTAFAPFPFHALRHLFAVDSLRLRRYNLYDLQKIMGHASVKTTELYLDYLTPEERRWAEAGGDTYEGTVATVFRDDKALSA